MTDEELKIGSLRTRRYRRCVRFARAIGAQPHERELTELVLEWPSSWLELDTSRTHSVVHRDHLVENPRVTASRTTTQLDMPRLTRLDDARARDAGGSGLGLAIVRRIANRLNATVEVGTSHLGGAEVIVRFRDETSEGIE
jgi:hypothetical protein